MDIHKAKLVLSVYRESGVDPGDRAMFEAALKLATEDQELGEWFANDQAFGKALSSTIREIAPPVDLRAKILAGSSVSRVRPWFRRPRLWLCMAALFAVLLSVGTLWVNRPFESGPENYVALQSDMGTFLSRFFLLDKQSDDLGELKEWMGSKHAVEEFEIPQQLASSESVGCELIRWHGRDLFLVCFDVEGELVHLILVPDGKSIEGAPQGEDYRYAKVDGKWTTATFTRDEDLYLVATLGEEQFLRGALAVR